MHPADHSSVLFPRCGWHRRGPDANMLSSMVPVKE